MRRVAEIIHIVNEERDAFLNQVLHMDCETENVLWFCGVRKQQYFELNDLIFMTFEYEGDSFKTDMDRMAAYLDSKGYLVQKRRRDVPLEEREDTNWWAPVKRLGTVLNVKPESVNMEETNEDDYMVMLDGVMEKYDTNNDISFDENDWEDAIRI